MGLFNRARIDKLAEYLREKNYPRALQALEMGLEKDPENMIWREQRAKVMAWLERAEEAADAFRELGSSWALKGFHAKAVAAYRKAVELQPEHQELHRELAELIGQPEVTPEDPALDPGSLLFSLFETRALEQLISETDRREFAGGDIIVTEGELGASLFVIVEGEVKVYTIGDHGEHVPLTELGPGDLFGEVAVLSGTPRTATVTACDRVTAIEIGKEVVDRVAVEHPQVKEVLRQFCERRAERTIEALIQSRVVS